MDYRRSEGTVLRRGHHMETVTRCLGLFLFFVFLFFFFEKKIVDGYGCN